MCGICGFVDPSLAPDAADAVISTMTNTLFFRGPDSSGRWRDQQTGIALGHRRLAIVDLTPSGHQPMASADGRFVVSFNGEIYNHLELRRELQDHKRVFKGKSDTETLVEACATWGVQETTRRLNGIFAFSVWDKRSGQLTLVRDHLGVKPLYWAQFGKAFVFASQLRAIRAFPGWEPELDLSAVATFHRLGYISGSQSIYKRVNKLKPGTMLVWSDSGPIKETRYWELPSVASRGESNQFTSTEVEATRNLENLLRQAVRRQMMSDVPIGAFLSGGIDSSTVAAMMQQEASRPIKTYSIGFSEPRFDEAKHAKCVAAHLRTDHTELYVRPEDALSVIPDLPEWFDEPFADASAIPTYLVSKLARNDVTVALSGDGGDELFAGYERYFQALDIHAISRHVPQAILRSVSRLIAGIAPGSYDRLAAVLPASWRPRELGHKLHRLSTVLPCSSPEAILHELLAHWPEDLVLGEYPDRGFPRGAPAGVSDPLSQMQLWEALVYLPDDILAKVDRASMAVSLETRVPILDVDVVEFAWRLPRSFKVRKGKGKWLLRQVLHRHVPAHLVDRPKMGFGVPIADWLRGPLLGWSEEMLCRAQETGLIDPQLVSQRWSEHKTGTRNWSLPLWDVLMFQAWYERWMTRPSPKPYTSQPAASAVEYL